MIPIGKNNTGVYVTYTLTFGCSHSPFFSDLTMQSTWAYWPTVAILLTSICVVFYNHPPIISTKAKAQAAKARACIAEVGFWLRAFRLKICWNNRIQSYLVSNISIIEYMRVYWHIEKSDIGAAPRCHVGNFSFCFSLFLCLSVSLSASLLVSE